MTKTLSYFVTGCNVLGTDRLRLATQRPAEGVTICADRNRPVNDYSDLEFATGPRDHECGNLNFELVLLIF